MKSELTHQQNTKMKLLLSNEYWGLVKNHSPFIENTKTINGVLFLVIRHGGDQNIFKWQNSDWHECTHEMVLKNQDFRKEILIMTTSL